MTITCTACGTVLAREDATAAAGPHGTHWYCRDTDGCRARMDLGPTR